MIKNKCHTCSMEGEYKKTIDGVDTFYCEHHKVDSVIRVMSQEKSNHAVEELFPLFLVLGGIVLFSFVRQLENIDGMMYMMDFMGIFLLTFGLLKTVDLKGFASGFSSYDVIAKRVMSYGYVFPFLEIGLGLMYLFGAMFLWQNILVLTIAILGMYSAYVVISNKQEIRCVCLGTLFHIPMTWATFIENFLMAVMVVFMFLYPMTM